MRRWYCYFGGDTPSAVQSILAAVPLESFDQPTGEGRFTPREVICHLADFEELFLGWIETAVQNPGAPIVVPDESELSVEKNYSGTDVGAALDRFVKARSRTVAFVKSLDDDQMKLISVCPGRGPMTVADHCGFWLGHDLYHVEQLASVLPPK